MSPRETRSATKKRREIMMASEAREVERKKRARAQRVDSARRNGQLLEFDTSGNPLTVLASPPRKRRATPTVRAFGGYGDDDDDDGDDLHLSPDCAAGRAAPSSSSSSSPAAAGARPDPTPSKTPAAACARASARTSASARAAPPAAAAAAAARSSSSPKVLNDVLLEQLVGFKEVLDDISTSVRSQSRRKEAADLEESHGERLAELQALVAESKARAEAAERLEGLVGEVRALESLLGEARERERHMGGELDGLRRQLEAKSAEARELRDRLRAQSGSGPAGEERDALTGRVAELERMLAECRGEAEGHRRSAEEGRRSAREAGALLERERSRAADLADELERSRGERERLGRELEEERRSAEGGVRSAAELEGQREAAARAESESRLEQLREELDQRDERVRSLSDELEAERSRAREGALTAGKAAESTLRALERRALEGERRAEELGGEVRSARARAEEAEGRAARAEGRAVKAEEEARGREGALRERVGELEEAVRQGEDARLMSDAAYGELQEELLIVKKERGEELQKLTAQLARANAAREAADAEVGRLAARAEEERARAEQLKDRAASELDSTRAEVEAAKGQILELRRERDELARGRVEAEAELAEAEKMAEARAAAEERAVSAEGRMQDLASHLESERDAQAARADRAEEELRGAEEERDEAIRRASSYDARERKLLGRVAASDEARRSLHDRVIQLGGNIRVFVRVRPPLSGEEVQSAVSSSSSVSSSFASSSSYPSRRANAIPKRTYPPAPPASADDASPFQFPGLAPPADSSAASAPAPPGPDHAARNVLVVTESPKDRGGLTPRLKRWSFGFDGVFAPRHGQDDLWAATEPMVQSAIDGYNVCIFAYGQTGSGKTHTMLGDASNPGIVTRAVSKLFDAKSDIESAPGGGTCTISVELLEIYNERVRDLLATDSGPGGKELDLRVHSNEAVGNVLVTAGSREEVGKILTLAQGRRCVKATQSNAQSSRSHMMLTVHFEVQYSGTTGLTRRGKLHICDLAGSERLSKSGSMGTLLKETQHINSSLAVLSNVIEMLQANDKHVPYRESKLTKLLQNSLGGDSKTLAIVCLNPLAANFNETICSLRFAAKVNRVELKATGNFTC